MASSIWRDYAVSLGSTDPYYFRVRLDSSSGTIIYTGIAHKRPGESNSTVRINDICADYLTHQLATASGFLTENWTRTFVIQKSTNNSTWSTAATVTFADCWDYINSSVTNVVSFPIKRLPPWAMLPVTVASSGTYTSTRYTGRDGTGTASSVSVSATGAGTCWYTATSTTKSFKPYGSTAIVNIVDCIPAVAYYVNMMGGWSVIPLEGCVVEGDDIARKTFTPEYSNTSEQNLGERTLVNNITERFTLHTGPLTRSEVAGLRDIFRSPLVYLNIDDGEPFPVVLDNKSVEYRHRGNGATGLPSFTISAHLSQDRLIR